MHKVGEKGRLRERKQQITYRESVQWFKVVMKRLHRKKKTATLESWGEETGRYSGMKGEKGMGRGSGLTVFLSTKASSLW